jgi:thiol-disulfide isomerase/thioredoxin
MRRIKGTTVAAAFVILGIAIAIAATRVGFLQGTPPQGNTRKDPAPEFVGIDGWLNSPPLTIASLRGKVVLVDFWAYSCVNCVRTFPALRAMYDRYHALGFEIVGVHSPEFSFEKQIVNVRAAIERNDLRWPVALDNRMDTWTAYRNHYWPHVYVIDARGKIRFDYIGEGGDDLIQARIRALLVENHATLPAPVDFSEPEANPNLTPEIYAGTDRGSYNGAIGNPEGYGRAGRIVDYKAVKPEAIAGVGANEDGIFFLEGRWVASPEYLEAAGDGAKLLLPFSARDVFMVAAAPGDVRVSVLLDGNPVPAAVLAADAPGGVVRVSRSDLYRLLHLNEADVHLLTLVAGKGFRLYTFTFG